MAPKRAILAIRGQKTKGIQSYLRVWGSYDPTEWDPPEPKNWVLYGRSVKKCKFLGQKSSKIGSGGYQRACRATLSTQKNVFLVSSHNGNKTL